MDWSEELELSPEDFVCTHPNRNQKNCTPSKIRDYCLPNRCPCLVPVAALEGRDDGDKKVKLWNKRFPGE